MELTLEQTALNYSAAKSRLLVLKHRSRGQRRHANVAGEKPKIILSRDESAIEQVTRIKILGSKIKAGGTNLNDIQQISNKMDQIIR